METSIVEYTGDLMTRWVHLKSGSEIITDAPVDNQGKGSAFSPTDTVATALASCMLTIMGIAARTHGFSIDGAKAGITKIMNNNPRRIGEIIIQIDFGDHQYSEKEKKILEHCTKTCPVALSLHPEIKQSISLNFK